MLAAAAFARRSAWCAFVGVARSRPRRYSTGVQVESGLYSLIEAPRVGRVRPEVLLVNDAVLAAEEGLDAAVAVSRRPGDHRVAGDHVAVDEVGVGAAWRRRPLRGEDPEVVAVIGLRLFV